MKQFKKAFGLNEFGKVDFPTKMGGCSCCFPHGIDTRNSTRNKNKRNWKNSRLKQWK
ncbi:phosphate ABC transporter substrate-binding protein [Wenyingzhuangia aestuarii]|uniref:phosphate ABC transporter substrate-binding protein n=1 Tax=Wenyingzhuangia aestuarii TaxID=1647582 RepID=UPI00143ADB8F|nr:phosphate ABC transporter substrate-binding protein [Wenyingzhuangia aestuarii]NJB83130.1 hypothetical protein [Wenyingzhuangia aestuarii]